MMKEADIILKLRSLSLEDFSLPPVGSKVTTAQGEGYVLNIITLKMALANMSGLQADEYIRQARQRLGVDYKAKMATLNVQLANGTSRYYKIWEVQYDWSQDITDVDWL